MVGAPAFQVSGVVVDESGKPVANAVVRLSQEDAGGRPMFMMQPWNQSRTDQAGRFSLGNVTPGAYTLLAIAPELFATAPAARRQRFVRERIHVVGNQRWHQRRRQRIGRRRYHDRNEQRRDRSVSRRPGHAGGHHGRSSTRDESPGDGQGAGASGLTSVRYSTRSFASSPGCEIIASCPADSNSRYLKPRCLARSAAATN